MYMYMNVYIYICIYLYVYIDIIYVRVYVYRRPACCDPRASLSPKPATLQEPAPTLTSATAGWWSSRLALDRAVL